MTRQPEPRTADLVSPFLLRIVWKDGITTEHQGRDLRLACPCAGCVEEGTGRQLLKEDTVPKDIMLLGVETVGRYALSFIWSDGHRTGIFSWPRLRRLGGVAGTTDE